MRWVSRTLITKFKDSIWAEDKVRNDIYLRLKGNKVSKEDRKAIKRMKKSKKLFLMAKLKSLR